MSLRQKELAYEKEGCAFAGVAGGTGDWCVCSSISHSLAVVVFCQASELLGMTAVDLMSDGTRKFLSDVSARWPCKFPPTLAKLFRGDIQVGRSVTARECMERVYKGRVEMRETCKRWAKRGFKLRYEIDPEGGPLEARYIIEELPTLVPSELKDIEE